MRVALVHDYLNQFGGGERVLQVLMEMFPDAPIYTLLYDEQATKGLFAGRIKGTSFLNKPFVWRHHRFFIPLMPLAARKMNLHDQYDLVISDTAGFAKGISYGKTVKHLSYIHTPLRYAWETDEYFNHGWRARFFKSLFAPLFAYVKRFDFLSSQRPDQLIANSRFIAAKIKRYYGREAEVIYPPVDLNTFYHEISSLKIDQPLNSATHYFLALGRLLRYKRFDLVIEAFNQVRLPLVIAGTGPDEKRLRSLVRSPLIEFQPFVKDDRALRRLYSGAKAVLFPQIEDFGLVAAESLACGTPVIAYKAGGALEIIRDGENGVFFKDQTSESLLAALRRFQAISFNHLVVRKTAQRFSREQFEKEIRAAVARLVK